MVLAAGLGTRLRPLTERVPKALVEVGGRPLVGYALAQLAFAGIRDVIVNVHHLAEAVESSLGDGSSFGVRLRYSRESELLDSGGGIRRARWFLEGGTFLVLNADTIQDVPLPDLLAAHRESGAWATLVVRSDPRVERYGVVEVDEAGKVRRILGRPQAPGGGRRTMYAGVAVFEPEAFRYFPEGKSSLTRDVLPRMLSSGAEVGAYVYRGYWRTVDTAEDLAAAREEVPRVGLSFLAGSS